MRIAIDIKHFKHGSSGIARYLTSIMDCLQEIDNKNEYFLFECRPSAYIVGNPKWRKILIPWKLSGTIWQQVLLPYHLRKNKIDVLWAPEQTCPIIYTKGIRIVTTIYDLVFVYYPQTCQASTRIVYSMLFPLVLKRSNAVVTISDYIRNSILSTFRYFEMEKKTCTILCGKPDWQLPATYSPINRKDFLFFAGNLEPRKNLVNLVKALIILNQRGLKVQLHLAGPQGWKNKEILKIMNKPEIQQQIIYLGYLSEEDLKNEYLTCRALVYPSIYEGLGLPVLEALCLDCLVLTSRRTVMEEIAKDNAIYFNPNDPEDIATVIEKIYDPNFDREEYLAGTRGGMLQAYSWHNTAIKLLDVLTDTTACSLR
jgi:glycosyltransferase involved in cell wall biosynthesis